MPFIGLTPDLIIIIFEMGIKEKRKSTIKYVPRVFKLKNNQRNIDFFARNKVEDSLESIID